MAKTGSKTFKDIVAEARQAVPELSVDEVPLTLRCS